MKKALLIFLASIVLLLLFAFWYLNANYFIITGYAAKKLCGCHLIAQRNIESILSEDLAQFPLNFVDLKIERNQTAVASLFGYWESKVKFDGNNCVLVNDHKLPLPKSSFAKARNIDIPKLENPSFDIKKIKQASDLIFDQPNENIKKTRALVVVHKDSLIYERYGKGFNKDSRILAWSMNKSIANALVGMLVKDGKLQIENKNLFEEWSKDERRDITLNDLLQMQSGLDWDEEYAKRSDATRLLFEEFNCSSFAIDQPLEAKPGSYWEYSSGTTNVISNLIRETIGNDSLYRNYPYEALFDKLGMSSMTLDTDQAGNYILSSFGYATPRDWAKLGLLYLNNGIVQGDTILDKSWIDYSVKPAAHCEDKSYGAQFWLNAGLVYPDVPEDMFSCNGYQGQYVFIIPSEDLVVVRMGLTNRDALDMNDCLSQIIKVIN